MAVQTPFNCHPPNSAFCQPLCAQRSFLPNGRS
jgi:hypothetical protein